MSLLKGRKAEFMMLCCVLMWSTGGIFIKSIPWNSVMVSGSRSLITVFMLLIYMKVNKMKFEFDLYSIFIATAMCLSLFVYVPAMQMTTAANATLLAATHPIFIIIFAALLYKKMPTKREIIVVTLCTIGISIFFLDGLSMGGMLGNLFALTTGFAMGVSYMASSRTKSANSNMTGVIIGHSITALIGIPIGVSQPLEITPTIVATMIAFGIINTGLATFFYNYAVRNTAPLNCSLIAMLEIILGPFWVFLMLGEVPSTMAFVGGSILMGTIVWWCLYNISVVEASQERTQQ